MSSKTTPALMRGWLASRAGSELDRGIRTLLGNAPLSPGAIAKLTATSKIMGRDDPQSLAIRATRLVAVWPEVGPWVSETSTCDRERLAGLIWLAMDLASSHGTSTTWEPGAPADPPAETP